MRDSCRFCLLLAVVLTIGCSKKQTTTHDYTGSSAAATAPAASPRAKPATQPNQARLSTANNDFAVALLAQLTASRPGANLFFSPYSISSAMAMTYAGARNITARQMAKRLYPRWQGTAPLLFIGRVVDPTKP